MPLWDTTRNFSLWETQRASVITRVIIRKRKFESVHQATLAVIKSRHHVRGRRALNRPANRRLKNIVLVLFNKCQNEASFLKSITKSRTQVLQSQSDVCQTTDKDVPLTPMFFVCALTSDKIVCLASKQGFSWVRPTETVPTENDLSIGMNLCVAACCSVSCRY